MKNNNSIVLLTILAVILVAGCISQKEVTETYTCSDGTVVNDITLCETNHKNTSYNTNQDSASTDGTGNPKTIPETTLTNNTTAARSSVTPTAKPYVHPVTVTPIDTPTATGGLIVIREGASGEDYARQIANEKGWRFLRIDSSSVSTIQEKIRDEYKTEKFKYLLMIGTNDELPFAEPTDSERYKTDPILYADVNGDGLLELSIGRLPFSSESELRTYFTDLSPKGNNYYFEHYPLAYSGSDPLDEFTVREYTYANCLNSYVPQIKYYRNSDFDSLVEHYRTATLLDVKTHGSGNLFTINDNFNVFAIESLCADCKKLESSSDPICRCAKPEYLSNRPILIHLTCNNAKSLGIDLIKNGAGAFIGYYNTGGGTAPLLSQSILNGMSVGDAFKNTYNSKIVNELAVYKGKDYTPTIANIDGLNNFDLTKMTQSPDTYGSMLYGDPSLKLPDPPTFEPSVKATQGSNKIVIDISSAKKFDIDSQNSLLCYTGENIGSSALVNKDYGAAGAGAPHPLTLSIPVIGVNKITNTKAVIDGNETVLPSTEMATYRVSLLKGYDNGLLFLIIADPVLDYRKDVQIIVEYE